MKTVRLGASFAVFVLFFGIAMLEAFQSHDLLKAAFWVAVGILLLAADNAIRRSSVGKT